MKTIQEMLQELSQCIVTVSGEFRFRTNWNGGKVPQPDLDTFDPNVPFCIENVGDVPASVQYNTKNTNIRISKDYKTWNDYTSGTEIELNPKDRVYIKSDYVLDESGTPKFHFTNANGTRLRARGNIASLIYGTGDEYITKYTIATQYCYKSMFDSCASLIQAPELPATTLASNCYNSMFSGCTSLTKAPELPATTLANYCYRFMFNSCANLTQAPKLPATTLADYCYDSMFQYCTSLAQAPELPATTLASGCYSYMFEGCTSLTHAPELPATTLVDSCYYSMFSGCVKINYVKCLATDASATNCTKDWLSNVSATGTFECDNKKYFTLGSPDGIPTGWTITEINPDVEKPDLDVFDPNVPFCIENVGETPVEIGMYNYTEAVRTNCEISYDLQSWQNYNLPITQDANSTTISKITLTNKGDRVYIKADLVANPGTFSKIIVFNKSSAKKIRARGNIASLNKGTNDAYKTDYLTADSYCYANLFSDCGLSLTQAPDLPATTLNENCYSNMFHGCTQLVNAPELPATTLAYMCYESMFRACVSLTQAPELPAITLANYCYSNMFKDCTSLTQAPELPAATLSIVCYSRMFQGCTKLNYVKCLATDISAANCTASWLEGVATTGDFYAPVTTRWTTNSYSGIPSGWTRHGITPDPPTPPEPEKPDLDTFDPNVPFCIENVGDVKASIQYNTQNTNIRVSKDYKTWNDYTSGTEIELNPTDRVYIKSDYVKDTGNNPRFVFNGDGAQLRARGNIASLIYGSNDAYVNKYTSTEEYCYNSMFRGCTSLTQASELPATTLASYCYNSMFNGCTSLTQAPELPATTLNDSCYNSMFYGCTSLTKAPELPATTLTWYCYNRMFEGCTSLTQAPELPSTTLALYCYNSMFYGCTSLTQAPELPATTLTNCCYQYMFLGCASLTKAPELPATILTRYCYNGMFRGCTKLNYVKCLATNIDVTGCVMYWLSGVATTGDFYAPASTNWTTGENGIPQGWTRHDIT